MWSLENPWWEYLLRPFVLYVVILILFKIIGKKPLGELSPFDLVLLLIVGESVGESITGGDSSLPAALITVFAFLMINYIFEVINYRSKAAKKVLEGEPQILIHHGVVNKKLCRKEHITPEEIESVLREHKVEHLDQVKFGILETNGKISIIENKK